ncbi:Transposase, Ptta/En/Spm, plant [Corchorus olitorius]|uniref:Transposase, Ptta/En/Spm, plant n=1 Tax=Corchorus olitorius TaxID=93759 RepID=A0A1R3HGG1_9ROSI|nr:Transposase, Ptta/En/Spm, plant [Corchorus olitorius]
MGEEASDDVERRTECFPSVNPSPIDDNDVQWTCLAADKKNIQITSTTAPEHAAGSGSSSSRGQSQGSDIPEALEASDIMITNAVGDYIRRRGKTRLRDVANLKAGDRIFVQGNGLGQPIGDSAGLLAGFCGKLSRNGLWFPIDTVSWNKIDDADKNRAVDWVKEKFDLRGVSDIWLNSSLAKKWRDHKNRLKRKYFDENLTPNEVKGKLPQITEIVRTQFYGLVDYWFSPEGKERARKARQSREKQAHTHTSGSKSFARMGHEMSLESNGRPVGRLSVYVAAHTRANGSPMEATMETVQRSRHLLTEEMNDCETTEEYLSRENSLYNEVLGPEKYSRVRGFGLLPRSNRLVNNNAGPSTSAANAAGPSRPAPLLDQEYQRLQAQLAEMEEKHAREQAKAQAAHESLLNEFQDLQTLVHSIQHRGNEDMQDPDATDEESEVVLFCRL